MVQPGSNKKAMAWTVFHTFCEVVHPELQGWAACNLCGQKYKVQVHKWYNRTLATPAKQSQGNLETASVQFIKHHHRPPGAGNMPTSRRTSA